MERILTKVLPDYRFIISEEFKAELVRKSLHMLIALIPYLAGINRMLAVALLFFGTVSYVIAEKARSEGFNVLLISSLTLIASRKRDREHFVMGPVTLGMGAMLTLLIYPHEASIIAIYALAFGDSFSSIIGKLFGKVSLPFSREKTLEGSMACFVAVYVSTYYLTRNMTATFIIALTAAFLEALPARDMDNIILPIGTGYIASLILPFI